MIDESNEPKIYYSTINYLKKQNHFVTSISVNATTLSLSNRGITTLNIPEANMLHINKVDLSHNKLNDLPLDILNLPNLKTVVITNNFKLSLEVIQKLDFMGVKLIIH